MGSSILPLIFSAGSEELGMSISRLDRKTAM
jgi:hypothetical protein